MESLMGEARIQRLQIMLDDDEMAAETWRFKMQMPSRTAAIRTVCIQSVAFKDRDMRVTIASKALLAFWG